MERWERERILGEWGIRDGTPRSRAERRQLEQDVDNPLAGAPLRERLRNFRPDAERYVASLGGPLPYMSRLREIHVQTLAHEESLGRAWAELAGECGGDPVLFERRWRALADRWSFEVTNDLIDRHNRYFPVEARLPMDPITRDFALVGGEHYAKRPLDAAWVLDRFPPVLGRAAA